MSIEGANYNGGERKEVSLSYEQGVIIQELLGTDEQVYKKVKEALDALERNQAGSFEVGTPAFYNSFIKCGGKGISAKDYNLCKNIINDYIEIVKTRKELENEVDEYHDGLKKKDLAKRDFELYGEGHEEYDK